MSVNTWWRVSTLCFLDPFDLSCFGFAQCIWRGGLCFHFVNLYLECLNFLKAQIVPNVLCIIER